MSTHPCRKMWCGVSTTKRFPRLDGLDWWCGGVSHLPSTRTSGSNPDPSHKSKPSWSLDKEDNRTQDQRSSLVAWLQLRGSQSDNPAAPTIPSCLLENGNKRKKEKKHGSPRKQSHTFAQLCFSCSVRPQNALLGAKMDACKVEIPPFRGSAELPFEREATYW